jgi:predicted outer membrane repeat protein
MHGNMTAASITAVVALGVMAAAGPAPAQAAQDAPVRVPCNSAALARVVTGAASGATLSLAPGCHYVLTAGLPMVTQDLTIIGNGATLNRSYAPGTPAFTILSVDGAALTLTNLNFRNGNGAISVTDNGQLTVTGGIFAANTAANGGAIYIDGSAFDSQVSGASFSGNRATGSGGAIYGNSGNANIFIDHCSFKGNRAEEEGGAFWEFGFGGEIADSTFRGNAAASGGGIWASEDAGEFLTGVVAIGNIATGDGGGIWANGGEVANSWIIGNYSGGNGGGIDEEIDGGDGLPSEVDGTLIKGNIAAAGGGIYEDAGLMVTGSTISGNGASTDGGGIDNADAINGSSVASSTISGNRAGAAGGGVYTSAIDPSLATDFTSTTISGNRAGTHGGGIYNLGTVDAESTQITGNRAVRGGGIYNDGTSATTALTQTSPSRNRPDNCEPTGTITGCTG